MGGRQVAGAAQDGGEPCDELSPGEGFDQVVVGARVEEPDDFRFVVAGGGHQHGNGGDAPDHAQCVSSVQIGQPQVEDHRVDGRLGDLAQGAEPVARAAHGIPVLRQDFDQ